MKPLNQEPAIVIEKKYGVTEDSATQEFHKSRRMFCIFNDTLHIADSGVSYSHAVWFEQQGWMASNDDSFMNQAVRGFVNAEGNVYFFIGYDFDINPTIERIFLKHLPTLAEKLDLKPSAYVYGGLIKQATGGQWPAKKIYGTVYELLQKTS